MSIGDDEFLEAKDRVLRALRMHDEEPNFDGSPRNTELAFFVACSLLCLMSRGLVASRTEAMALIAEHVSSAMDQIDEIKRKLK